MNQVVLDLKTDLVARETNTVESHILEILHPSALEAQEMMVAAGPALVTGDRAGVADFPDHARYVNISRIR